MPIEHILNDADTLQSLADRYLGDPTRWYEIVEYNKLDAPYIVRERTDAKEMFGNGYVTIVRANFQSAVTIKAGWTLHTKPYLVGGQIKSFVITEDVHVLEGTSTFSVHAKCTLSGHYGNVSPGMVEVAGKEFLENGIQVLSVENEEQFEGGKDLRILVTGESIFIPGEDVEALPEDIIQMLDMIGGEDLDTTDGFLDGDGFGDIRSVSGIENIVQAINNRLVTERGELPLHPEYGTNMADIIGSANSDHVHKLVELEIYEALSYEDRIQNVEIVNIDVQGTSVMIDIRFQPVNSGREVLNTFQLSI